MRRLAIVTLALAAATPAARAATWTVQPTPTPTGAVTSLLKSVSCPSATTCIAVGTYVNQATNEVAFAERWNGSFWTLQSLPLPVGAVGTTLSSVSCSSPAACTAVGSAFSGSKVRVLVERWNGTRWSVEPAPNPSPQLPLHELLGVSCPSSTACVAVGNFGNSLFVGIAGSTFPGLIERWNGHHWTAQRIIHVATGKYVDLNAVSCKSLSSCMAIGSRPRGSEEVPTAWRWNGQQWSSVNPPNHGEHADLLGVSCVSMTGCVAVGAFFVSRDQNALAERWNGHHWTVQTPPRPTTSGAAELTGVSCLSATHCTAVGASGPADPTGGLAEGWTGLHWAIQPTPGGDGWPLNGVSCRPTFCTAVGSHAGVTLAERYS